MKGGTLYERIIRNYQFIVPIYDWIIFMCRIKYIDVSIYDLWNLQSRKRRKEVSLK